MTLVTVFEFAKYHTPKKSYLLSNYDRCWNVLYSLVDARKKVLKYCQESTKMYWAFKMLKKIEENSEEKNSEKCSMLGDLG